jgi:hypothetical protein
MRKAHRIPNISFERKRSHLSYGNRCRIVLKWILKTKYTELWRNSSDLSQELTAEVCNYGNELTNAVRVFAFLENMSYY